MVLALGGHAPSAPGGILGDGVSASWRELFQSAELRLPDCWCASGVRVAADRSTPVIVVGAFGPGNARGLPRDRMLR